MQIDLVPIWTLIIGVGVFMYVLLDGFDLGVGMLSPLALSEDERTLMMNTVAPVWDGNQTWLVLGGTALLAAFPLAFAILIPALYFPVMLMLLGLILRGVAFEFRLKSIRGMPWWNRSFYIGSFVATEGDRAGREFIAGRFKCLGPSDARRIVASVAGVRGDVSLAGRRTVTATVYGRVRQWATAAS